MGPRRKAERGSEGRGWGAYVVAGALLVAGYYFGYAHSDVFVEKTQLQPAPNAEYNMQRIECACVCVCVDADVTE